jgi:hypothetical protein
VRALGLAPAPLPARSTQDVDTPADLAAWRGGVQDQDGDGAP